MDDVTMISDLVWIPRGVAKTCPDKIKLTDEELKELIQGTGAETSDMDDDEDEDQEDKEIMEDVAAPVKVQKKGIRGSQDEEDMEKEDEGKTVEEKYMAGYDDEEKIKTDGMRGVAMYSNQKDDPYITEHVDSDAEEEKDEFEIRPDDNMVVVAKIFKDEYTMEVFVYNENDGDWYCHHDYILDAPPLCLEPIQHDPGNDETGKGNLVAVGTMNSVINIWDLDIVNAVTPVVTLGEDTSTNKRKKRDGSALGHSDAVISLAWNKITQHVLASGGADKQVVLWDLDEAKAAQVIPARDAEVQALCWHPVESTFMILGTMAGTVQVVDCRENDGSPSAGWKFRGQVEKVLWNHFNPFTAFVATDDGMLRHIDMRQTGAVLWEGKAHEESMGGLSLSYKTQGLLTTVGHDETICVWKVVDDGSLSKVHAEKLALGQLHSVKFNPDVGTVCAVGGAANDLIRVMDFAKIETVVNSFS